MSVSREVKLFRNGRNQAVRIPRDFELPGNTAVMRREGDRLVIESTPPPGPNARLLALLSGLQPPGAADAFPDVDDVPPTAVDL